MRLLLDEMLSGALAQQLRALGRDVRAVVERPELRGLSDAQQFERAQADRRAFVTYDREDLLADVFASGEPPYPGFVHWLQ
ncbi:MAG: DUF5615 family PIN-like protein [Solirubrobacteraceae bacterium MAG38_C4-C5]|nr:DUF5615 family PIN-like protein [Candidatus Siliceabacter maunaloa]